MDEKLIDSLEKRLDRIEAKLDKFLEADKAQDTRLTKLESQAGFVKWSLGALGSVTLLVLAWALERLGK